MAKKTTKDLDTWYLNSYVSKHICNNKHFFSDLHLKSYKFITVGREIIRSKKTGIVYLSMCNGVTITFNNFTYTLRWDSNLILLIQLWELDITYYDYLERMILKQGGNTIRLASKYKNFFILDTKTTKKVMITKKKGRPTYFQSQNRQIRLWHQCFGHASNTKIIQISKLINGINLKEDFANASENQYLNSESESNDNVDSNANNLASIYKVISIDIEAKLCNTCVESKYTKIDKSKRMISTTQRLQEIFTDLWGPHNPLSLSSRNNVTLLFVEYIWKFWILLLKSKDEFFDMFKL